MDQVDVPSPLSRDELRHVVVVFDDTGNMLHLYLDGELLESDALASTLRRSTRNSSG